MAVSPQVAGRAEVLDQRLGAGAEVNMIEAVVLRRRVPGQLQRDNALLQHGGDQIGVSVRPIKKEDQAYRAFRLRPHARLLAEERHEHARMGADRERAHMQARPHHHLGLDRLGIEALARGQCARETLAGAMPFSAQVGDGCGLQRLGRGRLRARKVEARSGTKRDSRGEERSQERQRSMDHHRCPAANSHLALAVAPPKPYPRLTPIPNRNSSVRINVRMPSIPSVVIVSLSEISAL